jgi:hypothetical protein
MDSSCTGAAGGGGTGACWGVLSSMVAWLDLRAVLAVGSPILGKDRASPYLLYQHHSIAACSDLHRYIFLLLKHCRGIFQECQNCANKDAAF